MTASIKNWLRMSPPARADGLAQADLPSPFGDRDQDNVHDADPADDKRNRGDRSEKQAQRPRRCRLRLHVGGGRAHLEVLIVVWCKPVALAQQLLNMQLDWRHRVARFHLDHDEVDRPPVAARRIRRRIPAAIDANFIPVHDWYEDLVVPGTEDNGVGSTAATTTARPTPTALPGARLTTSF
jgi:hypothetical protein